MEVTFKFSEKDFEAKSHKIAKFMDFWNENSAETPMKSVPPVEKMLPGIKGSCVEKEEKVCAVSENSKNDDEGIFDSKGEKWNAELHSPNKTKTKEGVWRLKSQRKSEALSDAKGPDDKEVTECAIDDLELIEDTNLNVQNVEADDLEFEDHSETFLYTDAELSRLANVKATEMGSGVAIHELINIYVPVGSAALVRNIPKMDRANFVHQLSELKPKE